jgi:TctA family transporter
MLRVPHRLLFPLATFFICIGVFSSRNSLFDVGEVAAFGAIGALLLRLDFPLSPIVLGYVLGPMLEENFRRTMLLANGSFSVFVERPICLVFIAISATVALFQLFMFLHRALTAQRRVVPGASGTDLTD